jgi:putative phosphoesterase
MILGILSDNHGHAKRVRRALDVLRKAGAGAFVHCGDIGDADVFDELAGERCWFVWGNNDWPDGPLLEAARRAGLDPPTDIPLRFELGGRRIAVFHGHEREFQHLLDRLEVGDPGDADVDYVFFGHTHVPADARLGGARLINPGALHRAPLRTVATLDLERDTLQSHLVE